MMSRFSEKLDGLDRTLDLVLQVDFGGLAAAIAHGRGRRALAVGSGGSAIVARFFARCRDTLLGEATEVVTPADLVVGNRDLSGEDVWLFSAGADNCDSVASVQAARTRSAASINIVTRNPSGVATRAGGGGAPVRVFVVPVADTKDGFLATHSLVSATASLVLACDLASPDPVGARLGSLLRDEVAAVLVSSARRSAAASLSSLSRDDLLLIVADPQVCAVAELIETSAWEAAICAVQRTDFRNFAHGRHTWLHHRAPRTFILALTGHETRSLWEEAAQALPATTRRLVRDFGDGGRLRTAIGLVEALVVVESMGLATGIDPGKPGVAAFGRELYASDGLLKLSAKLTPAARQKRAAVMVRDDLPACARSLCLDHEARLAALAAADVAGIVLDYDGTVITDAERFGMPRRTIIDELVRIDRLGVRIAIATGRGGSAGTALRAALPDELHERVTMGYYNGAHVQPLVVDIEASPPTAEPELTQTFAWMQQRPGLFSGPFTGRFSAVQISVKLENIVDTHAFQQALAACPAVASGAVRFARSGHSIDFFAAGTSKRQVVDLLRAGMADNAAVLCFGDSGARAGNDNELLSHGLGISVGTVCGRHDGCWSLFGTQLTGPEALLRVLVSLKRDKCGRVRIDMESLALDIVPTISANGGHDAPSD